MSEASASAPRRFDVLTITWNNLEGLQRTWDSVSSQDFDNWRWLIVDGGSTDGTVEWLTSLTDERVDWQSGPDGGALGSAGLRGRVRRSRRLAG